MSFNKHLIILGTARSGTSWLSETISRQYRYRMLFEPEHETRTPKGHLLCDQWLTNIEQSPKAYSYLKKVFLNRVDCDWIAQNSNRHFKRHLWPVIPKKYIIKFVRANLLGHYLSDNFNVPVVHLLRSPYDVIYSQKQVKFPWLYDLDIFASQTRLVNLLKETFNLNLLEYKKLSDLEILCLRWCIENVVPLERIGNKSNKIYVLKYEELRSDINVFFDLCNHFNLTPVANIREVYKTPSSKTHPSKNTLDIEGKNKNWNIKELQQINHILDIFKTQLYKRL